MTYSEKLKDPRWQKMRLKVMERDGWECRSCGSDDDMLAVHHFFYIKGKDPWEYNIDDLITYCSNCHESEHHNMKNMENSLIQTLKEFHFDSEMLHDFMLLGVTIQKHRITIPQVMFSILTFCLENKETQEQLEKIYFDYLHIKNSEMRNSKCQKNITGSK